MKYVHITARRCVGCGAEQKHGDAVIDLDKPPNCLCIGCLERAVITYENEGPKRLADKPDDLSTLRQQ